MLRPVLPVACLLAATTVLAFDYAAERGKEVRTCQAIDPSDSESGLVFNPDGYRSYYRRSKCFQDAAVRFRDPALCEQVRERTSVMFSSWGYSAARCRQLVSDGLASDRRELEAMRRAYAAGGITLRDFRIERNGNGRDIDIIPAFAGTYAHGYVLTFELLTGANDSATLLHSSGYHLDATSNLRIYVPAADIRQRVQGFTVNRVYTVRATTTFDVGFGGPSGYWSDAFIDRTFPKQERAHVLVRQAAF